MALQSAQPLHRRSGPFVVLDFGQIQVQLQVEKVTAENLGKYLRAETARMRELFTNMPSDFDKVIVIVDGSVALLPQYEARQLQADWIKANKELLQRLTHQIAVVVPNAWVRAIAAAIFAIAPVPVPMTTFGSSEEAIGWALKESSALGGAVRQELVTEGHAAIDRLRASMVGGT